MNEKLRCMTSVYLSRAGKLLMLFRKGGRVVNEAWVGSAGGHFEKEELNDPEACILRELYEELGIKAEELEGLTLKYVTLRRTKGEIRQNYYFFASLREDCDRGLASNEGDCRWFDYSELSALNMPFTAKHMMTHYLKIGRFDNKLYGGIANAEGVVFSELPNT